MAPNSIHFCFPCLFFGIPSQQSQSYMGFDDSMHRTWWLAINSTCLHLLPALHDLFCHMHFAAQCTVS